MSHSQSALSGAAVAAGLQTKRMGQPLHWFDQLTSTNDIAQAFAEAGAPEGTAVLAGEQTGGRGRLGRRWASPPGGLWLSVVLRPSPPATEWPRFGFAASVAATSAIEAVTQIPVRLKWPNDLIVEGRKLGGVLVEATGAYVVVGIGINVNVRRDLLPPEIRPVATSLLEWVGHPVDLVELTQEVLRALERYYQLVQDDPHAVLEQWKVRSVTLGRQVRVIDSAQAFEGVAESVDDQGALIVRTDTGLRRVFASDVSVREPQVPSLD